MYEDFKNGSGIYAILNKINEKRYVGSARDLKARRSRHFTLLRKGKHYNKHLQGAYDVYGEENFSFSVLEYVENIEILLDREEYYIQKYNSNDREFGYNQREISDSNKGLKHSEETKQILSFLHKRENLSPEKRKNMSEGQTGKKHSEETKKKIGESNKGKKQSEEAKEKISKQRMGFVFSEESIKKMSESHKGKKQSQETIEKRRKSLSGENNPNYGKKFSEERKAKMSKAILFTKKKDASSNYLGVCLDSKANKWMSYIKHGKKRIYLGRFDTEIEAALAFNEKCIELYGENARINIVEQEVDTDGI